MAWAEAPKPAGRAIRAKGTARPTTISAPRWPRGGGGDVRELLDLRRHPVSDSERDFCTECGNDAPDPDVVREAVETLRRKTTAIGTA